MYIATFTTRHFTFIACGDTDNHAAGALLDGWRRYLEANPHVAITVAEVAGDMDVRRYEPGAFYIDGEKL